jgi:uncharacterized protein
MTLELIAPFLIGLLGSLHCLGMCGPLIMAYSMNIKPSTPAEARQEIEKGSRFKVQGLRFKNNNKTGTESFEPSFWNRGFFHHLAYHFGRIFTYGILGALTAGLFNLVGVNFYLNIRGGLILGGGALITFLGLVSLKVIPMPARLTRFSLVPQSLWNRLLPPLFTIPAGSMAKAGLGAACGLLPCCLSCSMLIKAAITENMVEGFMTMAAFGLGTVPALLAIGLSASLVTLRTRIMGERLAALSVMAMGLILMFKGINLCYNR